MALADLFEVIEVGVYFSTDGTDYSIVNINIHNLAVLKIARRLCE